MTSRNLVETIPCLLCGGVISFRDGDKTKFDNHALNEHAVYFNLDILLAVSFMDIEERIKMVSFVSERYLGIKEESLTVSGYDDSVTEVSINEDITKNQDEFIGRGQEPTGRISIIQIEGDGRDNSVEIMDDDYVIYGGGKGRPDIAGKCSIFVNKEDNHNNKKSEGDIESNRNGAISNKKDNDIIYGIPDNEIIISHSLSEDSNLFMQDNLNRSERVTILKKEVYDPDKSYIKCKHCSKVMKRESYPNHKLKHIEKKKYPCDICGVSFRINDHLKKHNNKFHKSSSAIESKELLYACSICSKQFYSEDTQKIHMKIHYPNGLKQHKPIINVKCCKCEKEFESIMLVDRHMREDHVDSSSTFYIPMK